MTKTISLILALAMTLGSTSAYAATDVLKNVHQEVQIGVYGTDGPSSPGDQPASQVEEFGEANRGLIFEKFSLEADFDNYDLEVEARDLNKNTRGFVIEGGNRGKTTWELKYDEMPHLYTNEAKSLFQHGGSGDMRISSASAVAIHNSNSIGTLAQNYRKDYDPSVLNQLVGAQPFFDVGIMIKNMGAGVKFHPAQNFTVELDAMRQTKYGSRPQAASFGFSNAIELAAPIDESVVEGGLEMLWAKKAFQLAFNYHFSDFTNNLQTLTWDNPKVAGSGMLLGTHYSRGDGSPRGQMAMAPDNKAHSMKFEGGVNFGDTGRFGFEGGYQRWTSMNPMLAYTNNANLNGAAGAPNVVVANGQGLTFDAADKNNLPARDVHGIINVYTYMAKLSGRPVEWLRASLLHDSYIMENRSKELTVPGWAVFDQNWHADPTTVLREQFRHDKTTGKLEYDIAGPVSGNTSLTNTYKKQTRAVDKGREFEVSQGFTIKPSKNLWVNLGVLASGRRANGWDFQHYPGRYNFGGYTYFQESPGLMRPDVADRNRLQGRVQVQWMPGNSSVNLSAKMSEDRFRQGKNQDITAGNPNVFPQIMGVLNDRHTSVALDASLELDEKFDMDLFYGYDYHRQLIRSGGINTITSYGLGVDGTRVHINAPQDRWSMKATEHSHIMGIGFTHRPTAKMKNNIGVDMTITRSNNDPYSVGATNAAAFLPLATSRRVRGTLKAKSQYKLTKSLTLAASYMFDRFQANDFAYSGVPTVLGNSSIFLGADPIKTYNFHSIGTSVNYKF